MVPLLERSVFLRTLNFLRVKHEFSNAYTYWYPSIATIVTIGLLFFLARSIDVYSHTGLINQLSPFLAVFAPFFLAALAAIATFSGPDFLDKSFQMTSAVTLSFAGKLGVVEPQDVTPRHFLSLLFGYCCVVSLTLFLLSVLVPILAPNVATMLGEYAELLGWIFLALYLFLFFQVVLLTLLGIYYLSDKVHRPS